MPHRSPALHLHAEQTPCAANKTERALALAYQATLEIRTRDAVQSVLTITIALVTRHVSTISA